jgi:hypothetical protein
MRLSRSHPPADTAHPVFGRGNPRTLRVIRQRLGNAGWEDSNCVPGMHSCRTGLRCPNCSVRKTRTGRELNSRPYRVDFGANTPPKGCNARANPAATAVVRKMPRTGSQTDSHGLVPGGSVGHGLPLIWLPSSHQPPPPPQQPWPWRRQLWVRPRASRAWECGRLEYRP